MRRGVCHCSRHTNWDSYKLCFGKKASHVLKSVIYLTCFCHYCASVQVGFRGKNHSVRVCKISHSDLKYLFRSQLEMFYGLLKTSSFVFTNITGNCPDFVSNIKSSNVTNFETQSWTMVTGLAAFYDNVNASLVLRNFKCPHFILAINMENLKLKKVPGTGQQAPDARSSNAIWKLLITCRNPWQHKATLRLWMSLVHHSTLKEHLIISIPPPMVWQSEWDEWWGDDSCGWKLLELIQHCNVYTLLMHFFFAFSLLRYHYAIHLTLTSELMSFLKTLLYRN